MKPAIVVIAYNRPKALARLLKQLDKLAHQEPPTLVISVEGAACQETIEVVENFTPNNLIVRIIQQTERLGLRDHVIACGDLTEEYGAVILLEDDLYVDPYFYHYAKSALSFYATDDHVAGVALYAYERNEFIDFPFSPMPNGYDAYPMKVACSWGQCWTRSQWRSFRQWYAGKAQDDLEWDQRLPVAVRSWPESSWKKYFQAFMVEKNKYFIYPYQAYSTNCSDSGGTHIRKKTSTHQVTMPVMSRPKPTPLFPTMKEKVVMYDQFMEPCGDFVWEALGLSSEQVEIDIQGSKPFSLLKEKEFALTIKKSDQKISEYSFDFRPPEFNLLFASSSRSTGFHLCRAKLLIGGSSRWLQINRYLYYSRVNFLSKSFIMVFIKVMPQEIVRKIMRRYGFLSF